MKGSDVAIADNMPNDRPQDLMRRLGDIERAIRELRAARNLDQASITALAGMGIRTSDFDGTDFAHPGTVGNYFGGDGLVINQAYFRPGSIGNDALTNPVVPQVSNFQNTNFAVTTSNTEVAGADVIVPDDCTRLLAHVSAHVYATNPNTTGGSDGTGSDALWCLASVGGVDGPRLGGPLSGSYGYTTSDGSVATLLTGLTPGSSIRIAAKAASAFQNFGADPVNTAYVTASLIWLR